MLCALVLCFTVSNAHGAVTCPSAYPDNTNASSLSDCYAWVVFYPNGSTAYPVTYNGHTYTTDYKSVDDPDNYRSTYTKAYYRNSAEYAASCAVSNGSGGTSNWCQSRAAGYYMTTIQLWELPNVLNGGTISVLERPGWTLHVYTSGQLSTVWTKTKNGTDKVFTRSTDVLTGRTNLYAKWDPNTYNISYTLNSGTNPTDQITTYTVSDSLNITLKNPYRNGYTFAGWCDNAGLTSNCTTSKKITAGAYGDKTYYAKWTQVTGTKTLKLFCGSGNVKPKTFTGSGTYMSINDVATECEFTNDKRDIWVCGDLSGNSSDGYSVSNLRRYQYASGTGALVGVTSNTMFCSPALTIASKQYSGTLASYLYYLQPGVNGDTGLFLRVAPKTPQPLQPVAISSFCSTIQSNAPYGTTFWWYNPDQSSSLLPTDSNYSKHNLFTTSYPSNTQLVNFATETDTIYVNYGYKVGLKCAKNVNVSKYITYYGRNTTEVDALITAARNKCNKTSSVPLYCYPNTNPSGEYQLTQPSSGGESIPNVFGEDSTCYFKYVTCAAGTYSDGAGSCQTCPRAQYCEGGDYPSNSWTGFTSCNSTTGGVFPNSYPGATSRDECFARVYTNDNYGNNPTNDVYLQNIYFGAGSQNTTDYTTCCPQLDFYYTLKTLPDKTRDGYHVSGWYESANPSSGDQPVTSSTHLTDSGDSLLTDNHLTKVLYAQWEPIPYTIHYKVTDPNQFFTTGYWVDDTTLTPQTYNINSGTVTLPTATKTGYDFGGWYASCTSTDGYSSTCSGNQITSFTVDPNNLVDKTFYSKWTPHTYTVTYRNRPVNPFTTQSEQRVYNSVYSGGKFSDYSALFPHNGYSATYWSCNINGSSAQYTMGAPSPEDTIWDIPHDALCTPGDLTTNTYTITYYKPDHTGSFGQWSAYTGLTPTSYDVTSGTVTLPTTIPAAQASEGHTFGGWYETCSSNGIGSTCTGDRVYSFNVNDLVGTANLANKNFYAKWTANDYTVTYKCVNSSSPVAYTDTRTYLQRYTPSVFQFYDDICANSGYNATQWTCSYNNTSETVTPTLTDDTDPTDGKWETPYDVACVAKDPTPVSFTVHFEKNNPTTDDGVSVQGSKSDKTCTYDSATCDLANTPTGNGFSRTGYTFVGWNTASDGSGLAVTAATNSSPNALFPYVQNGTVTLYAQWSANCMQKTLDGRYFLSYDSPDNSGTGPNDPNYTYTLYIKYNDGAYSDANCTTPLAAGDITYPVYDGFTFRGFYDSKAGYTWQNISVSGNTKSFTAHAKTSITSTWYAKWTPNIYTFTLNKNATDAVTTGATTTIYEKMATGWYMNSAATTAISSPDNLVIAPTRTGYTFGGYYRCAATTGATNCEQIIASDGTAAQNAPTNIVGNGTLYAKWTPNTIDLNWYAVDGDATPYNTNTCTYDGAITLPSTNPNRTGYTFNGWAVD